ncbi:hypothetical protein GCM10018785_13610 [Streptomyces longispororuber]|uniref:Ricin B lectin domain-containing protein n=1 Tax=Streptomyces longispororuber TaxID=68230 RepID=A0A919DIA9_9ACTN|nr:RICIN domain-containing protein [Streptomyces longispororuber]GHE45242.1 hypothetical protein GCM10018785_13610 [Streptomyces longispororuber]
MKKFRLATVAAVGALVTGAGILAPATAEAAPSYWTFKNHRFNTCITAGDGDTAYGTHCQGWKRQQWDWIGGSHGIYHQLKNRETGKCLTTDFENPVNAVWTSACDTNKHQWWYYDADRKLLYNAKSGGGSTGFLRTSDVPDALYTSSYQDSPIGDAYFKWDGSHT